MDDLISRQQAVEAMDAVTFMHIEADKLGLHESMGGNWLNADEVAEALTRLPSALPTASSRPIDVLNLSLRSYNSLRRAGIDTVAELSEVRQNNTLRKVRGLGLRAVTEIEEALDRYMSENEE